MTRIHIFCNKCCIDHLLCIVGVFRCFLYVLTIYFMTCIHIFCNKCCTDNLLCMVGVFRLSGTTDYCNFCYHWRQTLAIGTEGLIFELVFLYGRGTCLRAIVTVWAFKYNIKFTKYSLDTIWIGVEKTNLNKYWKKQINSKVTYWFSTIQRV